jgi:ribosome biogenesis GTPase
VIVVSCFEPDFSIGFVDRFLVGAESEGVSACICVTKIELSHPNEKPWGIYKALGYPVFEVSSKKELGLTELYQFILGKTSVFCGQSGVGKTSLLRSFLGSDVGKVGNVNGLTGKGRHTTTSAVLLDGPEDSNWIDTPGVREFGLAQVVPKNLASCFPEFRNLSCSQSGCIHLNESDCHAHQLIRYPSYRRILDSLLAGEN